jgi:uncharacterized protein (DUF302 family)
MAMAAAAEATAEAPLSARAVNGAYAFGRRVPYGFQEAVAKTREALKAQGFGVLTEIDVRRTMKEKLGEDLGGEYLILGACNPPLAHAGLMAEHELGALLPCNVVVYEDRDANNQTVVIAQDPQLMLELVGNPALAPVAAQAREKLGRALAQLGGLPR